jgi:hypothetical protein
MGWAYSFHDGEYLWDKAHVISYTLYNRTAKAIKLVEGGIIFRDLLGHEILKIKLSQDEHCPPHQSTKVDGTWNVSSIGEEYRLKDMAHDDIKPELQIRRVVFDDNTIWNAEVK